MITPQTPVGKRYVPKEEHTVVIVFGEITLGAREFLGMKAPKKI